MSKAAGYRPHIDGLRAVAILPVLLFHAHVPGFWGGFVGVDIFFVISGTLITGIVAREIAGGHFSLLRFYERRARRIVPALSVMVLAVLGCAAWLYLPGDFESVPLSALATALFAANLYFFSEVGYFQTGADTKPLLHMWSLGIEEQFYIGFPLLLMALARWAPRRMRAIVALCTAVSLGLAVALQGDRSGVNFYLLPSRAWELGVGALLALGVVPALDARWLREGVAAAGLAAIGYAVVGYDSFTPFPGATALLPVLGAAALIHAAPGTLAGRVLAWRPMVAIGLISYSLYLWHWPVIVFSEYALDARLAGGTRVAALAGAFALAVLSWRFVERPFRNPLTVPRRVVFAGSAVALGGIVALSCALLALGGWPGRFPAEVARMAAGKDDISPVRAGCHDRGAVPACVLGAPGVAPSALVWGDSHGVELGWALSRIAAGRGKALMQRTASSCPPVLGYTSAETPRCDRINQGVLDAIRADPRLRTVYLIGFWASPAYADSEDGLDATIDALRAAGRDVVLVGPVPPNRFDVPRRLARLAVAGRLDQAQGRDRAEFADAEARMQAIADRWRGRGFRYIDPAELLCDAQHCAILAGGAPLYFDHHHLSVTGARRVLDGFDRAQPLPF